MKQLFSAKKWLKKNKKKKNVRMNYRKNANNPRRTHSPTTNNNKNQTGTLLIEHSTEGEEFVFCAPYKMLSMKRNGLNITDSLMAAMQDRI